MTIAVGVAVLSLRPPSRKGLGGCSLVRAISAASAGGGTLGLDGVAAELGAQRREHLGLVGVLLPGGKTHQQRQRDDWGGHALLDGGLHGPAAFARIIDIAAQVL